MSKRKVCSICGITRPSRNWSDKGWEALMQQIHNGRRLFLTICPDHPPGAIEDFMDAYQEGAWQPKEASDDIPD